MPIADLPQCTTRDQVVEAIAKPIAYALAPDLDIWERIRRWFGASKNRNDRRTALTFCGQWGIDHLWSFEDHATGFELVVFAWKGDGYLVAIGSNDPLDWKNNLKDPAVGFAAYHANRGAVSQALAKLTPFPAKTVMGHSLGGAIAQYVACDFPEIAHCLTYQSAAVPPNYLARSQQSPQLKSTHFLHPSDPVFPVSRGRCKGGLIRGEIIVIGQPVKGFKRMQAHSAMLSLLPEDDHVSSYSDPSFG